jgi:hypothetical protein
MANTTDRKKASPESPAARRLDDDGSGMTLTGRKLGLAAFLFFLIKGLLWLLVPAAVYVWGC